MVGKVMIKPNYYNDSVALMAASNEARHLPGISEAVILMATAGNKELLRKVDLLDETASAATGRDLVIAVKGDSEVTVTAALNRISEHLLSPAKHTAPRENTYEDLEDALHFYDEANMVLISVPGEFAAWEARRALNAGRHVLLFSDNVSLTDERDLKRMAAERGLFMLGPDCGTAWINGAPLAFANAVRSGPIGIVAASGTGLQEVASLIHRLGSGISQGLGVGGRDARSEIGGLQMSRCLQALAADPRTEVVVLLSKPFGEPVYSRIVHEIKHFPKPIVLCLLGAEPIPDLPNMQWAGSLQEAAEAAVSISRGRSAIIGHKHVDMPVVLRGLSSQQKYLRALYTGGTLCYEALLELARRKVQVFSNLAWEGSLYLQDAGFSCMHTVVDLGDDALTEGYPHPMFEPALRGTRIAVEAEDPELAVLLLDFVLGYGSHGSPAAAVAPQIQEAQKKAAARGGKLIIAASVTGTDQDPQNRSLQMEALENMGVLVFPSNYQAVIFAAEVIEHINGGMQTCL